MRVRFALVTLVLAAACSSEYGDGTPPDSLPDRDSGVDAAAASDGDATPTSDAANDAAIDAPTDGPALENGTPCLGAPDCDRLVFVSSTKGDGAQGGVAGADAECQELADLSPKTAGHKFKAWLSIDGASAPARLAQGTRPYRRVDGTPVVNDWAALTSGSVLAPINRDENNLVVGDEQVWTATRGNGSVVSGSNCGGWANTASTGRTGNTLKTDSHWTDDGDQPCTTALRIYCFED